MISAIYGSLRGNTGPVERQLANCVSKYMMHAMQWISDQRGPNGGREINIGAVIVACFGEAGFLGQFRGASGIGSGRRQANAASVAIFRDLGGDLLCKAIETRRRPQNFSRRAGEAEE